LNYTHAFIFTCWQKINWLYESEASATTTPLLTVVRQLKKKFPGSRFSNILLAALSKSLRDFFEQKHYHIPKDMTVVIPARLYNMQEDPKLVMENKFSVAMQTVPIDVCRTNDRVEKIRNYSDIVVSAPDYRINYFMMSVVAAVFPDGVLKAIMNSKHATMAVSNLPGPNFTLKINGHEFESVGFFLPNIDQTACGVTILSYNNRLHFGMMADESSIESEEDLGVILKGMVDELHAMAKTFLN
jgi:diacylglycerol O-acyltransferase